MFEVENQVYGRSVRVRFILWLSKRLGFTVASQMLVPKMEDDQKNQKIEELVYLNFTSMRPTKFTLVVAEEQD